MRGLDPGLMNERISMQRAKITRNQYGEQTMVWTDVCTCFATVRPTSGGIRDSTGELVLTQSLKVWMRYRSDIDERMRVRWRGDTYRIKNLTKEYQLGRINFLLEKLDS